MNENFAGELRKGLLRDNEYAFSLHGRDYLAYGWDQCDGYVLNLEADGELIWQTTTPQKNVCADEFLRYYSAEL